MANTIGDLLIHEGLISAAQLAQALSCLKRDGAGLGDVLVSLGFLSSDQLSQFFRPVPQAPLKVADTGLSEAFLVDLLLKAAYLEAGTFSLQQISTSLSLPFSVIDELAQLVEIDQLVSVPLRDWLQPGNLCF